MAGIIVAGDAVAADVATGKRFSAGVLYNETGTNEGAIPEDVITQLDTINGEVIGTTAYDKMDAIEDEKAELKSAINAMYEVNDGLGDVLQIYGDTIATSTNSLKGGLDLILGSLVASESVDEAMGSLEDASNAIHDAIELKGVTTDANLLAYPDAIAEISGGGDGSYPKTGQTEPYATGDDGDLEKGYSNGKTVADNLVSHTLAKLMYPKDICQIFPGETSGTLTGGAGNWANGVSCAKGLVVNADAGGAGADWEDGATYAENDKVSPSGWGRYNCILPHVASNYQPDWGNAGNSKWTKLTNDIWSDAGVTYPVGHYIYSYTYGNYNVYKCNTTHVSAIGNGPDDGNSGGYWDTMTLTVWSPETEYNLNDVVYRGTIYYDFYICISAHLSSNHYPGMSSDWETYWEDIAVQSWITDTAYTAGDYVTHYDGSVTRSFKCISSHTSASGTEPDTGADWRTKWAVLPKAVVCKVAHTSSSATEPYWGASWTDKWVEDPFLADGLSLTLPAFYLWQDIIAYCNDMSYGGHTDWRMPNLYEMLMILDYSEYNPMIDSTYGVNLQPGYYWTSTTAPGADTTTALVVSMTDGTVMAMPKMSPYSPCCCIPVRTIA